HEYGCLDPWYVGCRYRTAIERHGSRQIFTEAHGQLVGHSAAVAEAGDADPAGTVRPRLQPECAGHDIFELLRIVDLAEQLPALVVIPRVTAYRRQHVGRECHEVGQRKPAGNVFGVRIEPAILVHDDDARQLGRRFGAAVGAEGAHEIALYVAVAVG